MSSRGQFAFGTRALDRMADRNIYKAEPGEEKESAVESAVVVPFKKEACWSPETHSYFPLRFRGQVRTLLLVRW